MSNWTLLEETLAFAVPLWIEQLRDLGPDDRTERARALADVVAGEGDAILFRARNTPRAFNALAQGLACLAYTPGGVRFGSLHFQATPPATRASILAWLEQNAGGES